MKRLSLALLLFCGCFAQGPPTGQFPPAAPDEPKLPNGKSQRNAIVKADYQKNLQDSAELAKLAEDLKSDLEKSDKNIVSVKTIKQTEEIEKLARNIRSRLRRY